MWVRKFPLLQPKKSASGELRFVPRDVSFAKGLKVLLVDEKKDHSRDAKILNERGVSYIAAYGKEKSQSVNSASKKVFQNKKSDTFSKPLSLTDQFRKIFPAQGAQR